MLELDECDQLLVTNPFADDVAPGSSTKNNNTLVTLTSDSSSDHHPLRTRSASLECRYTSSIPSKTVTGSETRPKLTRLLGLDGLPAEEAAGGVISEAPQGDSDIIIHPVGSNDSFAGVALRYGISIAAIRRANHMWPSDPIHLRTELLIPCGDSLPPRHKSTRNASTDTLLGSTFEPTPGSNIAASSFAIARKMILSALPARISLESLSSRTSTSEDHELDDLRSARALSGADPPFSDEGRGLAILATPPPSQVRCPPKNSFNHISSVRDMGSRSISSSHTISLERFPRIQPFATLPVRTSQLEPEPAMELPVRPSAFRL